METSNTFETASRAFRWRSLLEAIREKGLTPEGFAELLGTTMPTLRMYLTGEYSPSLERFGAMVEVLSDAPAGTSAYQDMARRLIVDVPANRRLARKKERAGVSA